jgi:hypothetical protein
MAAQEELDEMKKPVLESPPEPLGKKANRRERKSWTKEKEPGVSV